MPELHFNITADSSEMQKQLKNVVGSIEAVIREGKGVDAIEKAFDEAFNNVNDKLSQTRKAITSLQAEYQRLGEAASEAFNKGDDKAYRSLKAQQQEVSKQIAAYREVEQEITKAGDALEAFQSSVEGSMQSEDKVENMRAKFMEMRNELVNVAMQYRSMSDEERASAEGQALKQKLDDLQKRAGTLRDAMADVNRAINAEANDAKGFKAATQAAQLAISAWGGVTSVMQAFGVKSEDVAEIQADLQAALAASNALTQAQLVLQKESEVMQMIATAQEKARAAAIAVRTAAEGKGVIATKAATVAQAAFNAVASMNPYVLLAMAILSVVGGIALLTSHLKKSKKAQEEEAAAAKKRQEAEAEANKQAATTAANAMTKYQDLRKAWKKLKTESEKNKFLKDNADAFKELGLAIDGVNGAEKFFNAQTGDVVKAFTLRAKAAAVSSLIQKEWEKYYQASVSAPNKYKKAKAGEGYAGFSYDERKLITSNDRYNTMVNGRHVMTEEGAAEINRLRNAKVLEARNEITDKALKQAESGTAALTKELETLNNQTGELNNKLGTTTYKPTATTPKRGGGSKVQKEDIDEKIRAEEKANETLKEEQEKNRRDREKAEREHQRTLTQERIDAMEEGLPKILEQMKLDHKKEQDELDDEREDAIRAERDRQRSEFEKQQEVTKAQWEKVEAERKNREGAKYKEQKFQPGTFQEDTAAIDKVSERFAERQKILNEQQRRDNEKTLKDWRDATLAAYDDVAKKRKDIEEKYANAERALYAIDEQGNIKTDTEGNKVFDTGRSQADVDAMRKQRDDELNAIDEQIAQKSEEYKMLVSNIAKYSLDEIVNLIEFVEASLTDAESGGLGVTQEQIATMQATVNTLKKQKNTLEKQDTPAAKAAKKWNNAATAIGLCGDALQDLGKQIGGTVGEVLSAAGEIASTVASALNNIGTLVKSTTQGMTVAAETGKEAISSVEKASVILAIISAALQIAMKIASLFNNDAKHQKNIERLQHQIDLLREKYDDLGDVASRSFSKTAAKTIEEQNKLLEQQRELVQQQLEEEKAKKKTDKQAVYDYEKQLRDIDREIEDNKEAAIDAIFGSDLKSAIEDFADAYADAWGEGNSRAKAARDWVKHAIQDMVRELMKADIADKVEALRSQMMQFWSDNIITEAERRSLNIFANNIQREMDERYKWADDIFRSADESGDGTSGGFATMSQDSADELNGRFTSLQVTTQDIRAQLAAALSQMQEASILSSNSNTYLREIRDIQIINSNYLADIARDTRNLSPMRDDIARIAHNTDNL